MSFWKKAGNILKQPRTLIILLCAVLLLNCGLMVVFSTVTLRTMTLMKEVNAQLAFYSDSTNVLVSDVGQMRSEIKESLEERSGMLESWSITLDELNFQENTYTVQISVVPKAYTTTMNGRIYFGTKDFSLEREEYRYTGKAELSLTDSYEGNVTVLFEDGKSRQTEILNSYTDVSTDLTSILYGTLFDLPSYKDGVMNLDFNGYLKLDGGDFFAMDRLQLIVAADGQDRKTIDLMKMAKGIDPEKPETAEQTELLTTLAYSYSIHETLPVEQAKQVRIYLMAGSPKGYTFTYDLYSAELVTDENGNVSIDAESIDRAPRAAAYDPEGGCYLIEQ